MMFKTYQSLNHRERLRRSIGVAVFSFFFIVVLLTIPEIPRSMTFVFSLVFIVVGTYQIRKDYKNSKKEEAKNKWYDF